MSILFAELEPKLQRVSVSRGDIKRLLQKMDHDLKIAEHNRGKAPDWALKIAHQAILDGCAALMAAYGYRTKANGHHFVTLRFAQLAMLEHAALLDRAEMLRRRRHQVTYGTIYAVSEEEVRGALELAHQLSPILRDKALKVSNVAKSPG